MSKDIRRQQSSGQPPVNQPQVIQHASFYQGVIPKAEELAKYEQIQPGFASRIIKMTEDEGAHRRKMERRVINNTIAGTFFGQVLGFLSVIGVLYLCYFAFDKGHATQAATVAVAVLIGLGGAFKFFGNTQQQPASKNPKA